MEFPPLQVPSELALSWPGRSAQADQAWPAGVPLGARKDRFGNDPRHLLIEGDNLVALQALLENTDQERPRLILIDPPYNTDRQFFYADRHGKEKATAQQRRAAWLADLWPRLVLAHQWLADDGVLAVHIDEHEAHYLQVLLTEVFGPSNNLGVIIWDKCNPKGDARGISVQHESLLIFAKDAKTLKKARKFRIKKEGADLFLSKAASLVAQVGKRVVPQDLKSTVKKYALNIDLDAYAELYTLDLARLDFKVWAQQQSVSAGLKAYSRMDDSGAVFRNVSMAWPNKQEAPPEYFIPLLHPDTNRPCPVPDRGWRNPPDTMKRLLGKKEIEFGLDEKKQPERKYFLRDHVTESLRSIIRYGGSDDALLKSLGVPFDTPKPVALTEQLIEAFLGPAGGLVVDFYAGSGTVGHAAMRLEARGLPVRAVLVQRPEPLADTPTQRSGYRFCIKNEIKPVISSLTWERLRRAAAQEKLSGGFEFVTVPAAD